MDFKLTLEGYLKELDIALSAATSYPETIPQIEVANAARYSLLGGGKRIRAILVIEFCRLFDGDTAMAMPAACAVEMIHAYSLIHDDLPCMDDDALRRGKPTCHIQFGEAMALLAGDALLTGAFELLSSEKTVALIGAPKAIRLCRELSNAAGIEGMIGGQVIDMESFCGKMGIESLSHMHRLKTGALIRAAVMMGCISAKADEDKMKLASEYALKIGLAFQITDDILDVIGNKELLGKDVGRDEKEHKVTYVTLLGIDEAKRRADTLFADAMELLKAIGTKDRFLFDLTYQLSKRSS